MKTYENARIRVTLTEEQSARFDDRRDIILSHAMSVLGNRAEAAILETETVSDAEATESAVEELTYQYLSEHCRYNLGETLMRMNGGHRMSEGMSADVSAARAYARNELLNNPSLVELGRKSLTLRAEDEKQYRRARGNSEWQIEIIGSMPKQIGMCRYQEAV
jgi:hypothetical protein